MSSPFVHPLYVVRMNPPPLLIGVIFGIAWLADVLDQSPVPSSRYRPSNDTYNVSVPPAFNQPTMPLPANGRTQVFVNRPRVAPFEIKSSGNAYYLVKLEETRSGSEVLTVFVHGGRTVSIDVPLGTYVVKYACGTTWYGYQHLFGPETACAKADRRFTFEQTGDQVSGYTITLYTVSGGNLSTSRIPMSQF